jgi:hypothetical protein
MKFKIFVSFSMNFFASFVSLTQAFSDGKQKVEVADSSINYRGVQSLLKLDAGNRDFNKLDNIDDGFGLQKNHSLGEEKSRILVQKKQKNTREVSAIPGIFSNEKPLQKNTKQGRQVDNFKENLSLNDHKTNIKLHNHSKLVKRHRQKRNLDLKITNIKIVKLHEQPDDKKKKKLDIKFKFIKKTRVRSKKTKSQLESELLTNKKPEAKNKQLEALTTLLKDYCIPSESLASYHWCFQNDQLLNVSQLNEFTKIGFCGFSIDKSELDLLQQIEKKHQEFGPDSAEFKEIFSSHRDQLNKFLTPYNKMTLSVPEGYTGGFFEIFRSVITMHTLGDNDIFLGMAENKCVIHSTGNNTAEVVLLQRAPQVSATELIGLATDSPIPQYQTDDFKIATSIVYKLMVMEQLALKIQTMRELCIGYEGSLMDNLFLETRFNVQMSTHKGICKVKDCSVQQVYYNNTYDIPATESTEKIESADVNFDNFIDYIPILRDFSYYAHIPPKSVLHESTAVPFCSSGTAFRNHHEFVSFLQELFTSIPVEVEDKKEDIDQLKEGIDRVWQKSILWGKGLQKTFIEVRDDEMNRYLNTWQSNKPNNLHIETKEIQDEVIDSQFGWKKALFKTKFLQFDIFSRSSYSELVFQYMKETVNISRFNKISENLKKSWSMISAKEKSEAIAEGIVLRSKS